MPKNPIPSFYSCIIKQKKMTMAVVSIILALLSCILKQEDRGSRIQKKIESPIIQSHFPRRQKFVLSTFLLLMLPSLIKSTYQTMSKAPILSPSSPFKLALIQLAIGADKSKNLQHAKSKILEAAGQGANVVVLPVS